MGARFPGARARFGARRGSYGYTSRFPLWIADRHADYDAVIIHASGNTTALVSGRALRGTATPYFVFPHGMLDPWFSGPIR